MTLLKRFHHLGIVVKDLDRSIDFYHNLLGLEFATEMSPWRTGIKGARLRHVCLRLEGTILELLEFEDREFTLAQYDTGAPHFAFQVDNLKETQKTFEAKGIKFFSKVNVVDEGILAGWCWTYFHDPNGYAIELIELIDLDQLRGIGVPR